MKQPIEDLLGPTPREAEALTLVARGQMTAKRPMRLVTSIKRAATTLTILHNHDVPTRADAAAVPHRIAAAR